MMTYIGNGESSSIKVGHLAHLHYLLACVIINVGFHELLRESLFLGELSGLLATLLGVVSSSYAHTLKVLLNRFGNGPSFSTT
jgi:hypothetical protein